MVKNTHHTIYSRTTEAKFSTSIIHFNESKKGFIKLANPELKNWPVSDLTAQKIISVSLKRKSDNEVNYYKKKKIQKVRAQKQYTNLVEREFVYKPEKTLPKLKQSKLTFDENGEIVPKIGQSKKRLKV